MLETNCRNFAYAEELQSLGASMACNQTQVAIDQKGNIETEVFDTTGDLLNLLLGVETRVFGICLELVDVSISDRKRRVRVLATSSVVACSSAHRCHRGVSSDLNVCEGRHGLVDLMGQCRTVAPGRTWQQSVLPTRHAKLVLFEV